MRKMLTLIAILLFSAVLVNAQTKELTGKVTDSTGAPIAGASVNVKGVKKGTSAGADGSFKLVVPQKATLSISAVGYETQEIDVTNTNDVSILLHAGGSRVLNEIVVTALGL